MTDCVFLVNLLESRFSVIVLDDSVDGCGRAIRPSERECIGYRLLPSTCTTHDEGFQSRFYLLSELLARLWVHHSVDDAHLIQLFEISIGCAGLALFMHSP